MATSPATTVSTSVTMNCISSVLAMISAHDRSTASIPRMTSAGMDALEPCCAIGAIDPQCGHASRSPALEGGVELFVGGLDPSDVRRSRLIHLPGPCHPDRVDVATSIVHPHAPGTCRSSKRGDGQRRIVALVDRRWGHVRRQQLTEKALARRTHQQRLAQARKLREPTQQRPVVLGFLGEAQPGSSTTRSGSTPASTAAASRLVSSSTTSRRPQWGTRPATASRRYALASA